MMRQICGGKQEVISVNDTQVHPEFTVNFFDDEDCDEDDLNNNIYEVMSFPLLDDYLNNDIQLL